jgi:predicted outer membrane protein
MRKFSAFALATVVLCAGAVSAQETRPDPTRPGAANQEQRTQEQGDKTAGKAFTKADQEIAAIKLAHCRNEVELAKFAQQKSQNEQVKQFAAKMVKEHEQACKDLEKWAGDYARSDNRAGDRTDRPDAAATTPRTGNVQVEAGKGGVAVDVNADRTSERTSGNLNWVAIHQQIAAKCLASAKRELGSKEGAEFDKCFMGMQLAAHQKVVDSDQVFVNYVSAENRDEIEKCMEMANSHLKEAKGIMEGLANDKSTPRTATRE